MRPSRRSKMSAMAAQCARVKLREPTAAPMTAMSPGDTGRKGTAPWQSSVKPAGDQRHGALTVTPRQSVRAAWHSNMELMMRDDRRNEHEPRTIDWEKSYLRSL